MGFEILLSDIVKVEYEPRDMQAFQMALSEGETRVIVCLKDNRRIDATKPIRVHREDQSHFYLKIPNPCNHKSSISYIEATVARLASELLLQRGVLVPEYELIELVVDSPIGGVSHIPACLIEAIETFEPFGQCGDYFVADPSKIKYDRLSSEQQEARTRQSSILFCKEFAAYAAVTEFIGNNDPHQENFGTATYNGHSVLAAIDFDMAPMPFLIENELFGPFNATQFTKENNYHGEEGGRHTPDDIDLTTFPHSPKKDRRDDATPDNWITMWCTGFNAGLKASTKSDEFYTEVNQVFFDLAHVSNLFFETTVKKVVPKKILEKNPDVINLLNGLVSYFQRYRWKLNNVLVAQQVIKPVCGASPEESVFVSGSSDSLPSTSSFFFQRKENVELRRIDQQGGSPEMETMWPSPE